MSKNDLYVKIERLRSKMNSMAASGAGYAEVLKVSQELDKLIAQWYKVAA